MACRGIGGRGVYVETFGGNQRFRRFCDMHNQVDVRHIARLKNLRNHPVDIAVTGTITSNPRKLDFVSPSTPPDTSTKWDATVVALGTNEKHDFSHVLLVPQGASRGNQSIQLSVQATWPASGRSETVKLSFSVKV